MFEVLYNSKYYQVREGIHNKAGMVTFGTRSLHDALIDADGQYNDVAARIIAEKIYGYVDDKTLRRSTDIEFDKYINEHFM